MGEGAYLYIEVGQTFNVTGIDGNKDVDEDMDVSEANNHVSKASKLSAGDRICRGP